VRSMPEMSHGKADRQAVAATATNVERPDLLESELTALFALLEQGEIRYCVFRDHETLGEWSGIKEIDILVDDRDLAALRDLLSAQTFMEIPSWGHEPHRFFVTYSGKLRGWIKLDVITAIRLGKPVSALDFDYVDDFIAKRTRGAIAFEPSAASEFLVLLVKCIVNDRNFEPARLARLRLLFDRLEKDPRLQHDLEAAAERLLPTGLSWSALRTAFAGAAETGLLRHRPLLLRHLRRHRQLATLMRHWKTRTLGVLRPALIALKKRGVSVALLAPDGAGKSTLASALLRQRLLNARIIYMGLNVAASNVGLPTSAWLHRLKKSADTGWAGRAVLALLNFPNRLLEQWLRCATATFHLLRGRTVIFDRHIYDSWITPSPTRPVKKLRRWLLDHSCFAPNLVLLLDAPGTTLFARKGEHDAEALEAKRQAYLSLRDRLPDLTVIDASLGADDVESEAILCLLQRLAGPARVRASQRPSRT